jgi:hypothetical protein
MTRAQRWLVVGTLVVVAAAFAGFFLEFRGDDANMFHQEGLIIPLGLSSRDSYPWEPKLPAGFRLDVQLGLYARRGFTVTVAAFCGVLVPILLVAGAGYLALGRQRTPEG